MSDFYVFAFTAAFNPTLLAAVTVMLMLERPKMLLFGYLCGALMTSITIGLVITLTADSNTTSSSSAPRQTLNPAVDIAIGLLLLVIVFVVGTGRDKRRRAWSERRAEKAKDKPEPKWKSALSSGSARTTFVVGALLTLPGGSYLAGLSNLIKQDLPAPEVVLAVISFNLIMLMLLELPLLGYLINADWTARVVRKFNAALSANGGRIGLIVVTVLAVLLIGRGVTQLVS